MTPKNRGVNQPIFWGSQNGQNSKKLNDLTEILLRTWHLCASLTQGVDSEQVVEAPLRRLVHDTEIEDMAT
jgi:hypothetical protein